MKKRLIILGILAFSFSNCTFPNKVILRFEQSKSLGENAELYFTATFTKKGMSFYKKMEVETIVKQMKKEIINDITGNKDIEYIESNYSVTHKLNINKGKQMTSLIIKLAVKAKILDQTQLKINVIKINVFETDYITNNLNVLLKP